MNEQQNKKEFRIDLQGSDLKLRDKLLFLIDMIDSAKYFAAWIELEEGEEVEDKSEFQYKKEWDTFQDEHGQSLNLNVLYDNVHFGDANMIVYPVSNEAKQVKDQLIYFLPEDYHYFTFDGKDIVVHKKKPRKNQWGWVSKDEQYVLPYAHLFTGLSEKYIYEILRYEVDSPKKYN